MGVQGIGRKAETYGKVCELGIALPDESLELELSGRGQVHGGRQSGLEEHLSSSSAFRKA